LLPPLLALVGFDPLLGAALDPDEVEFTLVGFEPLLDVGLAPEEDGATLLTDAGLEVVLVVVRGAALTGATPEADTGLLDVAGLAAAVGAAPPVAPVEGVPPEEEPEDPPDPLVSEESVLLAAAASASNVLPRWVGSKTIWFRTHSVLEPLADSRLTRTVTFQRLATLPCSQSTDHSQSSSVPEVELSGWTPETTSASLRRAFWAASLRFWASTARLPPMPMS
jgi:hypothetical protein